MKTKPFVWLLVVVLVLGVGLGGVVIGVVAMGDSGQEASPGGAQAQLPRIPRQQSQGQSRQEETTSTSTRAEPPLTSGQQPRGQQLDQEELAELRQRIQSGEVSQEQLAQLREQFQGRSGQGRGGDIQGFPGGGGLTGTIESVEGNVVTLNTPQGPAQASVVDGTSIQVFIEGTLEDIRTGIRATVIGQRGEDGRVVASSISILPEGSQDFLGGRLTGQFGQGPGGQGQFGGEPGRQLQLGQRATGQGSPGRPSLTGTIESVEVDMIEINTPQGPLQAIIGGDTVIRLFAEGTVADLQMGARVTVIGQGGEDGTTEATTILMVPEGSERFPTGGFPGGRRLPGGGASGGP